jgi:hypothetical protein
MRRRSSILILCLSRMGARSGGPMLEFAQGSSSYRTLLHSLCSVPAFNGAMKTYWTCTSGRRCALASRGAMKCTTSCHHRPSTRPTSLLVSLRSFHIGIRRDYVGLSQTLALVGAVGLAGSVLLLVRISRGRHKGDSLTVKTSVGRGTRSKTQWGHCAKRCRSGCRGIYDLPSGASKANSISGGSRPSPVGGKGG